ncbi:MAG: ABC transporter substrate-binding protein, partial [Rhodospirillaceae bacterium]|nr:ABC transporter substrate-binding protein [Rhodospirillaceae bacterium]
MLWAAFVCPALRLCLIVLAGGALVALAACGTPRGERSVPSAPPQAQAPTVAAVPTPQPPQPVPSGTIKVGLLLPLSGAHAELGQALQDAANLAFFSPVVGDDLELEPRDTRSTPEGAAQAARDAIAAGARLLLGPVFAADAQA